MVMMAILTLTSSSVLAGCSRYQDSDCPVAEIYERAAVGTDSVTSAEFECGGSFGSETEGGTITLSVGIHDEASPIVEDIYRTFAADSEIPFGAMPNIEFASKDGDLFNISKILDDLGFSGVPSVSQMREKYGITPTPTP